MISDLTNTTPFNALPQLGDWIDLDTTAIQQSSTLAQSIADPQCRWQSYLALLALEGFQAWLNDRATPIHCDRHQARLIEPIGFDLPAVITQVYLNQFRICLIPVSTMLEGEVEIPASIMHCPSEASHFYVTVAVNPEAQQAQVQRFIQHDQLRQTIEQLSPRAVDESTYYLSSHFFDTNLENLLLFANSLSPSAIPFPATSLPASEARSLTGLLVQPVFKVSEWLDRQISNVGDRMNQTLDDLAWTIMPSLELATATGLRSNGEDNSTTDAMRRIRDIDTVALGIPEAAVAVHQDIRVGDRALNLSVIMWELPPGESEREWSLLAILEPLPEDVPDGDLRLMIADEEKTLIEKILLPGANCEVAQGIGFLQEALTITLVFGAGDVLRLPPFQF
jgi:hypothetical protein